MKNMKTIIAVVAATAAFAMAVPAHAQSTKHTYMDLQAAKRDIRRLEEDRAMARRYHEWKKVAQDDRLIAQDRYWVRRDENKLDRNPRSRRGY